MLSKIVNCIIQVTLFLLWCTVLVPSLKNAALYFWRFSWLRVLYCFIGTTLDVITLLICLMRKRKYLCNGKRYSKKENVILLYFKKPFKWAAINFLFYRDFSVHYQMSNSSWQYCLFWLLQEKNRKAGTFVYR